MGILAIVVLVVGALVLTAILVGLILAVTRRIAARFVQEIEAEGIVRRTGRVTTRISLTQ
ncbi:MAG: hypothetical protein IT378_00495 [Sandaracinaceae bacterium]|nr:hypothetical protein [Sandaracinaceae bacterium]